MKPLNPNEPIHITQQNLPHWRQEGTTYFVTSRLADSVPATLADEWRAKRDAWLSQHGATSFNDLAIESIWTITASSQTLFISCWMPVMVTACWVVLIVPRFSLAN